MQNDNDNSSVSLSILLRVACLVLVIVGLTGAANFDLARQLVLGALAVAPIALATVWVVSQARRY